MCAELPLGNLNPDPYPSYPPNTYTCEVITTLRVHSDVFFFFLFVHKLTLLLKSCIKT